MRCLRHTSHLYYSLRYSFLVKVVGFLLLLMTGTIARNYGSPYRGTTGFWAIDENDTAIPWGHNGSHSEEIDVSMVYSYGWSDGGRGKYYPIKKESSVVQVAAIYIRFCFIRDAGWFYNTWRGTSGCHSCLV